MACGPCWQQRQVFITAWRQGNPYAMLQAAGQGAVIATDKYIKGIDVNRKYPVTTSSAWAQRTVPNRRRPGA